MDDKQSMSSRCVTLETEVAHRLALLLGAVAVDRCGREVVAG